MLKEYIAQVVTDHIYQNVWDKIHNLNGCEKIDNDELAVIDNHIYMIALITTKELLTDILQDDKEIIF